MNFSKLIQQKQKGLKRTLVALLASAAMAWGSSVPAVAEIVNSVVASGFAKGAPIGASALEEVDVADQVATIILDKTAVFNDSNVNGSADVGETISYNFSIRNAGNVTLQNVVLVDDKVTPSNLVLLPAGDVAPLGNSTDTPAAGWASLAPGDTLNATATYSITLADLNAGQIINTARTDAATIPGLAVSSTDTVTTPLITSSSIALEKTASLDLGNGTADVGDVISYQFKVTNTGPTTLTNISVSDPLILVAELPNTDRVQDLIQLASIPSDPVTTASISTSSMGTAAFKFTSFEANVPQWPASLHASRKLINLSGSDLLKAGDRVGVYFTLTNTGDVPLTNISVQQPGSQAFGSALDILARNTSDSASIIYTHVLTDEDITSGQITPMSEISANAPGRTIRQTLNQPLSLLDITTPDELATASITPTVVPTLAPGAETIFTATYNITQNDIDAGHVLNTATAFGTNGMNVVIQSTDQADTPVPQAPAIALDKTASLNLGPDAKASVGDIVTYSFTLTNIGNTTLNDVRVTDPLPGITISLAEFDGFAPGDDRLFTGTYAITQADIDAGQVENQATASGLPANGSTRVTDVSDDPVTAAVKDKTIVDIPIAPGITLVKNPPALADSNGNGTADLGESLSWTFSVHNTGNVKLDNVSITDRNAAVVVTPAAPTTISIPAGTTNTTSFTATYVLIQADIDVGKVENTADVIADVPGGGTTGDVSHPNLETGNGPTVYTIPQNPGVAVLKPQPTVIDQNGSGMNDLGDVLNYTIRVINTGNVTLTNVVVTDPKANNFSVTIPSLLPGAVNALSVPVSYVITATDVADGEVVNSAFAESIFAGQRIGDQSDTSNMLEDDPTITPIVARPAIALVKPQPDIFDRDNNGVTNIGDQLIYTFAVTNTGNVDLNTITITDALGTVVSTRTTALEAGDTDDTSFTLTYTLVAADIARGTVTNTAEVVALSPTNTPARDTSDESSIIGNDPTVTILANLIDPKIALLKQATTSDVNGNGIVDLNDIINYTFSVTNTGNINLTNVVVTDAKLAGEGAVLSPNNGVIGNLARGATSAVLTSSHTITQADIDAGAYDNQALVTADFGGGQITDLSDDDTLTGNDRTVVSMARTASIAVVKAQPTNDDRNGNSVIDVGDMLNYAFEIHNTGNVTLYDVRLSDNNADNIVGGPIPSLAPGAVDRTTFTATRLVRDADALAGKIINSATVEAAESSSGTLSVTDISDVASVNGRDPTETPIATSTPALSKTAVRSTVRRGERVEYTIAATNLGFGPYDLVDLMPPGFAFVPGSASINGVAATPTQSGKTLTFASLTPNAQRKITLKLSLRASAAKVTGEFLNRARLHFNASGQLLADASARVTIKEEAIFDCGEIIGRVFDDANNNGYMDDGEVGLPGVRVVTVKGLLVTTDKHGRFHVTCADVPNAQIGSNFLMKLDPRTLPAGYALTTENPRDVRLTRGKITKLNFGASKRREVALDLTKDAFTSGLDLKPKFASGVTRLVSLLKQGKGQLTITYRCGVYAPIADERLGAVEELVQAKWKQEGGNKPLKIKTRVECGK